MPSGVTRGIGIASCERRQTDADWLAQNKPGDGSDRTPAEASRPVVLTPAGVRCRDGAVWARRGLVSLGSVEKTTVDRWRLGSHGRAAGASGTAHHGESAEKSAGGDWAGTAIDIHLCCNVSQLSLLAVVVITRTSSYRNPAPKRRPGSVTMSFAFRGRSIST